MYNEEAQKVFSLFFDYVYIYDHILMWIWKTYLAEVMKGINSKNDGNLLVFSHESELIHARKLQLFFEDNQVTLNCVALSLS